MIVLDRAAVTGLLDLDALIDAVADGLADLSAGRASLPARTAALVPQRRATMLVDMPAYVPSRRALVSKLVSVFPDNATDNAPGNASAEATGNEMPVRQGLLAVFDPDNGAPLAVMDAGALTALRTGAVSALSARLLARADAAVLAVLGTGPQARAHALAVARVRPFTDIRIAGRTPAKVRALADELAGLLGDRVHAADTVEAALAGADVVCAATYATEPVVHHGMLAPGAHVTSVGYHPAGRELDDATVAAAALFVEHRPSAFAAVPPNRDLADPVDRGLITPDSATELGEVLAGTAPGRTAAAQLTVYKSVGVGVEDAAAAALVLAAAERTGIGQHVTI